VDRGFGLSAHRVPLLYPGEAIFGGTCSESLRFQICEEAAPLIENGMSTAISGLQLSKYETKAKGLFAQIRSQ